MNIIAPPFGDLCCSICLHMFLLLLTPSRGRPTSSTAAEVVGIFYFGKQTGSDVRRLISCGVWKSNTAPCRWRIGWFRAGRTASTPAATGEPPTEPNSRIEALLRVFFFTPGSDVASPTENTRSVLSSKTRIKFLAIFYIPRTKFVVGN